MMLVSITSISAHDFKVGGLYYNINKDGKSVTVTYKGKKSHKDQKHAKEVIIPSEVTYKGKTYSVTAIGEVAFYNSKMIESIHIPASITNIGENAFFLCSNIDTVYINDLSAWCKINYKTSQFDNIEANHLYLNGKEITDLVIPNDVDSIGECFQFLCGLKSIHFHEGVSYIAPSAFKNSKKLETITVDSRNPHFDSRGNCNALIETATNKLIKGSKNAIIPLGITEIDDYAFYDMRDIKANYIPWGVVKIGKSAFYRCSLESIIIPNSVISIGKEAFQWCSLKELEIPSSVIEIGEDAFIINRLQSVVINGETLTKIADDRFEHNPCFHDVEAERLAAEKQAKKERRAQFWRNVGTVVASAALIGAAAYVESQSGGSNYGSAYVPSYSSSSYNTGSSSSGKLLTMSDSEFKQHIQRQMQGVMQQTAQQTAQNMEMQRQHFLAQYRSTFKNLHGRMPTESEEMEAYTNYLSAQNDAYRAEQMSKYGSSSSSSSSSSSGSSSSSSYNSSNSSLTSEKGCPHCDVPGTGNTPGNGKCKTCMGTGLMSEGFGLGQIPCTNCKSNVGKCHWCGGDGIR